MKLKYLMIVNAVFCLVIGIPMLLVPAQLMSLFGLNLNPGGIMMTRLYAGALFGNFLVAWFSKKDTGSISLYAAVLYLFIYNGINFLVTLWATLEGIMENLGYMVVAVFFFFTLGFGYILTARLKLT